MKLKDFEQMKISSGSQAGRVAILLFACLCGVWGLLNRAAHSEQTSPPEMIQVDADLNTLLQERYDAAAKLLEIEERRLSEGVTTLGRVCEAARWVRDSASELPLSSEKRIAALRKYVQLTRRLEENVRVATEKGAAPPSEQEVARFMRLDAEITLLRAKRPNN